jgi:uncharacterized lipoprotein YbaY
MAGVAIRWARPVMVACVSTAGLTVTADVAMAQSFFTGTATYRERMALPAGAVLEVTVEDVSRTDAPAVTIASTRVESPGPPPIKFKLDYDQRRLVSNRRYVVRARIVAGGSLLFTSDTVVPVLTANGVSPVVLMLRRVSGSSIGGAGDPLSGTSWRLVRFQGGDGAVLTPDDRSKYTLEFDGQGGIAARIDCNRGRGTWTSSGANQLRLGPLALTRAQCPPGSLHDQIVRQWGNVRSYVLRDGRLFLSLMADGGIYEFEPAGTQGRQDVPFRSPVPSRGPRTWTCTRPGAASDVVRVTLFETRPAVALLERGGVTRPAFQVRAASGTRFEGEGVLFWEARGEATFNWMGAESNCKPN